MTASLPTPLGPLMTSTRGLGDGTCGWLSNGDPNACSNSSSIGTLVEVEADFMMLLTSAAVLVLAWHNLARTRPRSFLPESNSLPESQREEGLCKEPVEQGEAEKDRLFCVWKTVILGTRIDWGRMVPRFATLEKARMLPFKTGRAVAIPVIEFPFLPCPNPLAQSSCFSLTVEEG